MADWRDTEKATVGIEVVRKMPWVAFKERFLEKYFPEEERDNKEKEFINLTQGIMTVHEYTTKFERMSRFNPHIVDIPKMKIKKINEGSTNLSKSYPGETEPDF